MIPGSVDPKTGNVPLHLGGGYLVHFEGCRDDGRVPVRVARSTTSPLLGFHDGRGLFEYVGGLPAQASAVSLGEIEAWLALRVAELASR